MIGLPSSFHSKHPHLIARFIAGGYSLRLGAYAFWSLPFSKVPGPHAATEGEPRTENREPGTGNWKLETGNWRLAADS